MYLFSDMFMESTFYWVASAPPMNLPFFLNCWQTYLNFNPKLRSGALTPSDIGRSRAVTYGAPPTVPIESCLCEPV